MLKIGAAMAILVVAGYFAFPQFHPIILSLAPFAIFAICPVSMIFCMKEMTKKDKKCESCATHEHSNTAADKNKKLEPDDAAVPARQT